MGTEAESHKQLKARTKCPFYGFRQAMEIFVDTEGNQCPLIRDYSPCRMEIERNIPDWKKCRLYNSKLLSKIKDKKIFPRELAPQPIEGWSGIIFNDWAEYILERENPPIDI